MPRWQSLTQSTSGRMQGNQGRLDEVRFVDTYLDPGVDVQSVGPLPQSDPILVKIPTF